MGVCLLIFLFGLQNYKKVVIIVSVTGVQTVYILQHTDNQNHMDRTKLSQSLGEPSLPNDL